MADRRTGSKKQVPTSTSHSFQKERFPAFGRSVHGSDSLNWREPSKQTTVSYHSISGHSPQQYHKEVQLPPPPPQDHVDNVTFLHSRWSAVPLEYKQNTARQQQDYTINEH